MSIECSPAVRAACASALWMMILVSAARAQDAALANVGVAASAKEVQAEWVAVAPESVAEKLVPLARHRRVHGRSAAIVTVESIERDFRASGRFESLAAFFREQGRKKSARYLFLVGDAAVIPPAVGPKFFTHPCVTDAAFVCDDDDTIPDRAIGRFPFEDVERVSRYVERVIRYENDTKPAGWRRRVTFLAADGGFGAALDAVLEGAASGLLDRDLPPEIDLRVLKTNASSPFGIDRAHEHRAILDLWNGGALIGLYAGHGSRLGLHTAGPQPGTRPIFTADQAGELAARSGPPFLIFLACSTGDFRSGKPRAGEAEASAPANCLASALVSAPDGAIAALAASEVSHPYADILFARELNDLFRSDPAMPAGELVRAAKAHVYKGSGPFREQADRVAATFGVDDAARLRLMDYEMSLYNFFGDPALQLRRPEVPVTVAVRGAPKVEANAIIDVEVRAAFGDGAPVLLTLDLPRSAAPRERGFPACNDRTLDQTAGELKGGVYTAQLKIPATIDARRLVITADVRSGARAAAGRQGVGACVIGELPAQGALQLATQNDPQHGDSPPTDPKPTSPKPADPKPADPKRNESRPAK